MRRAIAFAASLALLGPLPAATLANPAAIVGNQTTTGASVVTGSSTVVICGKPAARVGDRVVGGAPIVAGGQPLPAPAGSIIGGSATVLIEGKSAARAGDPVVQGPSQSALLVGCPTVIIGP